MPGNIARGFIYRNAVQKPRVNKLLNWFGSIINKSGIRYATGLARARATIFSSKNFNEVQAALKTLLSLNDIPTIDSYCRWFADTCVIQLTEEKQEVMSVTLAKGKITDIYGRKMNINLVEDIEFTSGIKRRVMAAIETFVEISIYCGEFGDFQNAEFLFHEHGGGLYFPSQGYKISLPLKDPHIINSEIHEIGHCLYEKKVQKLPTREEFLHMGITMDLALQKKWCTIFSLAWAKDCFHLLKESNFYPEKRAGHPQDGPNEFFATSVHAFYLYPDDFAERISGDEELKLLGKLVWLYLRDNIFNGKTFGKVDPFRNTNFATEFASLPKKIVLEALVALQHTRQVTPWGELLDTFERDCIEQEIERLKALPN